MAGRTEAFDAAAAALREGKAVVIPTDTLFGLAVSPRHAASPDLLYQIKERPSGKPVAWLVAGKGDLGRYGSDVPEAAWTLADAFWPGALTIIVKASDAVPRPFQSEAGTIGLRMPANDLARALAAELGGSLAVTSANLSGLADPLRFEDLDPAITSRAAAVIADSRPKSGQASTVVDCTAPDLRILREGEIGAAAMMQVLAGKGGRFAK